MTVDSDLQVDYKIHIVQFQQISIPTCTPMKINGNFREARIFKRQSFKRTVFCQTAISRGLTQGEGGVSNQTAICGRGMDISWNHTLWHWFSIYHITCTHFIFCKYMANVFSSSHALYESKMTSVTVTKVCKNYVQTHYHTMKKKCKKSQIAPPYHSKQTHNNTATLD